MRTRVVVLAAMLVVAVGGVTAAGAGTAGGLCANPQKIQGFSTCADVAAAEKEGALVVYSPDVEQGTAKMLEAFQAIFPKIKTSYVRLQTGALYAKVQAERQARSYLVDVLNQSDVGLAFDFQKRKPKKTPAATAINTSSTPPTRRPRPRPRGWAAGRAWVDGTAAYSPLCL